MFGARQKIMKFFLNDKLAESAAIWCFVFDIDQKNKKYDDIASVNAMVNV